MLKNTVAKIALIATAAILPVAVTSCGQVDSAAQAGSELAADSVSEKKSKFSKVHQSWRYNRYTRAGYLADAVRGIGNSTARRLIDDYHFAIQITSWGQFKNYMRTLDGIYRFSGNPTNLYKDTVERYGSDNSKLFKSSFNGGGSSNKKWGCTFDSWRSQSQRASCLADAVRGIGVSTATKLLSKGEFRYAPSNWEKFKSYMKRLESRHNIRDLYYNTVQRYGSSNKSKLY